MSYKYFDASFKSGSTKQDWINDYQALIVDQFENAANVYTIQEEEFFDSKTYQDIVVRINHVINTQTGEKVSDDYKNIIFKELSHPVYIGRFYKFDSNYWITINVDKIKTSTAEIAVKRCNNVLKWIDINGAYHESPCSIDMKILENRNYSTAGSSLVLPSGVIEVITQLNNETNLITPNQRFLFGNPGNWVVYKVQGGGVNNFNNISTYDNNSVGLLRLTMVVDSLNLDNDDLVNGIAEYYQLNYSIEIDGSISGNIGKNFSLHPKVKLNNEIVDRDVEYIIENELVASISGNTLSLLNRGSTNIRCQLLDNKFIYVDFSVTVTDDPVIEYDIRISPSINYIYEDETQIFTIGLYKNNVLSSDVFSFTVIPNGVPSANYVFTTLGSNSFSIKNNSKFLTDFISIRCTSGSNEKTFNFYLRGGW